MYGRTRSASTSADEGMRNGQNVLIVATDPMLAALVGGLVEALRLQAVFPRAGENPEAALARVRPLAVILMEGSSEVAGSELFVVRARRRGARVMLFGNATSIKPLREWADQLEVGVFTLPDEIERLLLALQDTHRELSNARRGDRRTSVQRERDAAITFEDASGTQWQVYDRRTGDRRQGLMREFISAVGDRRACAVGPDEINAVSPQELARQLARSVPSDGTSKH
jgi:hypothetical protein